MTGLEGVWAWDMLYLDATLPPILFGEKQNVHCLATRCVTSFPAMRCTSDVRCLSTPHKVLPEWSDVTSWRLCRIEVPAVSPSRLIRCLCNKKNYLLFCELCFKAFVFSDNCFLSLFFIVRMTSVFLVSKQWTNTLFWCERGELHELEIPRITLLGRVKMTNVCDQQL